jgi:membrane protein implicated in regulation of membrane protease activity
MTDAWWDRGERGPATVRQVILRSAAAFGAVVLTMAISWPVGIGVAILVCVVATVLANRRLERAGEGSVAGTTELITLLGVQLENDAQRA